MATGRGQLFRSNSELDAKVSALPTQTRTTRLQQNRHRSIKNMPTESSSSQRYSTSNNMKPQRESFPNPAYRGSTGVPGYKGAVNITRATRIQNFIERMPPEILIKILSYLDASSLFCVLHVNKLFHQLANHNTMWHQAYRSEYGTRGKGKRRSAGLAPAPETLQSEEVRERPDGYWKRLYLRTKAGYSESKWRRELRNISSHTGLPRHTERVLRTLGVTWEMAVSSKSQWQGTFEPSHAHFSESSVTVWWSGGGWPPVHQLASLQLLGVVRVPLNCPKKIRPGWRSLMAQYDMDALSKSEPVMGCDRLVNLLLLAPGVLLGVWKDTASVAFVTASLHFHRLAERSLLGVYARPLDTAEDRAPFDDVDPDYGLHGYTLHMALHNSGTAILSERFPQLFCQKGQISDGHIHLRAVSRGRPPQHRPLSDRPALPWRSEALEGRVENCCEMSLTLLDESRKPFWCVSTAVSVAPSNQQRVSYGHEGAHFLVQHREADGRVRMELVWEEEQRKGLLISLVVSIALDKVERHFGREYGS